MTNRNTKNVRALAAALALALAAVALSPAGLSAAGCAGQLAARDPFTGLARQDIEVPAAPAAELERGSFANSPR